MMYDTRNVPKYIVVFDNLKSKVSLVPYHIFIQAVSLFMFIHDIYCKQNLDKILYK